LIADGDGVFSGTLIVKDRKELVTSCTIVSATDNADTLVLWKIMRNKSRASVCEYFAFDGECFSRVTHAKTELYNCQPVSFILTADKKIENNDLWKTNCHVSMKVCALSNLLHNPNIHLSHSSSYSTQQPSVLYITPQLQQFIQQSQPWHTLPQQILQQS
jgi:hypothetical protein